MTGKRGETSPIPSEEFSVSAACLLGVCVPEYAAETVNDDDDDYGKAIMQPKHSVTSL